MKKVLVLFCLIGMSFAGSTVERIYMTPIANGKDLSANFTIIGAGNVLASANNSSGINIKSGTGGFNVTGDSSTISPLDINSTSTVNTELGFFTASLNNFAEITILNTSGGNNAQSGFNAQGNNGTATTNFSFFGRNSSGYSSVATWNIGLANETQVLGLGGNLDLGTDQAIKMYAGGTSENKIVMIVSQNGNVGIGTTAPSTKLEVAGTISGSALQVNGDINLNRYGAPYNGFIGEKSIKTSISSPYETLTLFSQGKTGTFSGRINLDLAYNGGTQYTAMTIVDPQTGTPRVGIGKNGAIPSTMLEVNGSVSFNGTVQMNAIGAGGAGTALVIATSGQVYPLVSSQRFKKNIQALDKGNSIMRLQSVEFDYKNGGGHDYGFIAEDVYKELPQVVNLDSEGKPYSLKNEAFIPLLLNEIKKLEARIKVLENK